MNIYGKDLAYVHDVGFGALGESAGRWLLTFLRRARRHHGLVLDLGCGSGRFASVLTEAGYTVWGTDSSPAMVRLARAAVPAGQFCVGSLYKPVWPADPVAVAVVGEGLNYALPSGRRPNVAAFFRRAHRVLAAQGLLLFDVVTGPVSELAPARGFASGTDWAVGVETVRGRARDVLRRKITTFLARRGGYRRSEERHTVYVYSATWVAQTLRGAGFSVRRFSGYHDAVTLRHRTVFAARKH